MSSPASIDDAIRQGQRQYQTARDALRRQILSTGSENTLKSVQESLEEFGLAETSRRLRNDPAQFGLKGKVALEALSRIETACRELLESRDALDLAISHSPHRDSPEGRLMAFDGKLARVTKDGEIREIASPERENDRDHDEEDRDQDREPG